MRRSTCVLWSLTVVAGAQDAATSRATELAPPICLEAAGAPIEIGALSKIAHAGPALGDVDGDGDRDLLVGDFPGFFWFFENTGTDRKPVYKGGVALKADGKIAKVPVY